MSPILFHREAFTITSPTFREVVLQISKLPPTSYEEELPPGRDLIFGEKFAECEDFRVTIKTCEPPEQEPFQRLMKETFWSLAEKGCVHFETVDSIRSPVNVHMLFLILKPHVHIVCLRSPVSDPFLQFERFLFYFPSIDCRWECNRSLF